MYVIGPGHGGPAMLANTWLEGSYTDANPGVSRDEKGMRELFRQFSFPGGVPSHVAPLLRQQMQDLRARHHEWTREHGEDLPEVRDWTWPTA
jgi:phosphoketolase